jgi:surface polysaccharide O-acyltransferase-like enzyme
MARGREVRYDVIRVVAMLFVIAVHVNPKPFNSFPWFKDIFDYIIYTCNGMFFMLSGLFNMKKEFCTKEDYAIYYKKKVISILLPYVLMTFLLYGYDYYQSGRVFEVRAFLEETINQFTSLNSGQHLWFMYSLIGLVMSAPFFSKMLHAMSDWEIKLLFWLSIGWNAVSIYLINDLGWNFHYGKWLMASWTIYFFLGYFHDRIIDKSNKKHWYLFGGIGFLVTILWQYVLPIENHSDKDFAPAYTFFVIAMYTLLLNEIRIKWEPLKKIIGFVAKHSFTVYMIHYLILEFIGEQFYNGYSAKVGFVATYLVCFVLSIAAAVTFDLLVEKLVQKPLKKMWKI